MVTKGFEEIYITVHLCHAHGVKEPETLVRAVSPGDFTITRLLLERYASLRIMKS